MSSISSVSIQSEDDLLKSVLCRTYHMDKRLPGRLVEYQQGQRFWKVLALVLLVLLSTCLCCLALLLILQLDNNGTLKTPAIDESCEVEDIVDGVELYQDDKSPFTELSVEEIKNVVNFIKSQAFLELPPEDTGEMNSNFIHLVELLIPPKQEVLRYLDGNGPKPPRLARTFIVRGNASEAVVEEYTVGPLPNCTFIYLSNSKSRKTKIPFHMRPFTKAEFKAVYKNVVPKVVMKAGRLLKESYNATVFDCGNRCLRTSITPVSSGFLEPGRRKAWLWFAYDVEFYTLHPLDFQFLVDMTHVNPKMWAIQKIFYANTLFHDLDELMYKYNAGEIMKTKTQFPTLPSEEQYSAVYMRGEPVPTENRPPPQQVQPSGRRFKISGNQVKYMDWKFNLRISPTVGTHLYDVRYKGDRIVYELSMQEIAVLYSGHSPVASMLYFADSAGLFGIRMRGMMPGVDCPDYAVMLDALVYTHNTEGLKTLKNSLCIFEHSPETPLRRHRSYGPKDPFYSGLIDHVLVVRMYICIINYDYVFDFIFHNNGAIEIKVSSTGYLATSFYYPEEEKYGTRISESVVAGLHHHLFHFKADIDVLGTENNFQTLNIGKEEKNNAWAENPTRSHFQNFFVKQDRLTEKDAFYDFDFNNPKYLLFYKNKTTELGHTPGYRIIHKGLTKAILPQGVGFEPSVSWARHQMVVTRQKDDEMTSSSMFAMWDAQDPVVNFDSYVQDDESIVSKDLVAWVTLGMYHIPQMENVPNTGTVGTTQSFFLTPFNYFQEDPSLASRDSVKVMPLDPGNAFGGASVERHNIRPHFDCRSRQLDEMLKKNSTFLFS